MTAVIDVQHLVKTLGRKRALDDLDLRVEPREVHGLLGPNGAGKATTLRRLSACCAQTQEQPRSRGTGAATLQRRRSQTSYPVRNPMEEAMAEVKIEVGTETENQGGCGCGGCGCKNK